MWQGSSIIKHASWFDRLLVLLKTRRWTNAQVNERNQLQSQTSDLRFGVRANDDHLHCSATNHQSRVCVSVSGWCSFPPPNYVSRNGNGTSLFSVCPRYSRYHRDNTWPAQEHTPLEKQTGSLQTTQGAKLKYVSTFPQRSTQTLMFVQPLLISLFVKQWSQKCKACYYKC